MEFQESTDSKIDARQINELRESIGWNVRSTEKWKEILEKSSFVYSFWDGDRLAGMGRLMEDGITGMLYDISIHKDYQGKGLGKILMERMIREAKSRGCVSLGLFMDERNEEFLASFYGKFGFEKTGTGMKRKEF
jgi:GNAT superfamily N-acetyltransferase